MRRPVEINSSARINIHKKIVTLSFCHAATDKASAATDNVHNNMVSTAGGTEEIRDVIGRADEAESEGRWGDQSKVIKKVELQIRVRHSAKK